MNKLAFIGLLLAAIFFLQPVAVSAQVTSDLGTIDVVMQDDGYIVIDDETFVFKASAVTTTYQGRPVRSSFLSAGLRVRYTTYSDGSISSIELIGPESELQQLDNQ